MIETKAFEFKVQDVTAEGHVTGYASVFGNVDQGGDVVESGAFNKTLAENPTTPLLWHHDPWEPIGLATYSVEDKGLLMEADLVLATQRGKEAWELAKAGVVGGLSIGYNSVKETYQGTVRKLQEVRLRETSMVTFPMNTAATITGVKSAVILDALALCEREAKAGRVLSAANKTLLESALEAITALLAAAEPPSDGTPNGKAAAGTGTEPTDWVSLLDLKSIGNKIERMAG